MSKTIYMYKKLTDPENDFRLVTLLPGQGEEDIKIEIQQVAGNSLEISDRPPRLDQHLEQSRALLHARANLPSGCEASEALDGRILYIRKDANGSISTSWQHPNPDLTPLVAVVGKTGGEEVPGQGPCYEALSYSWGIEDNSSELMNDRSCNNSNADMAELLVVVSKTPVRYATLQVGRNLEGALRRLRSKNAKRVLWIDGICINQADIEERNVQVTRMGDIFSRAERVIVWLGSSTEDSPLAMETLGYLGHQVVSTANRRRVPAPGAKEKTWFTSSIQFPFEDNTWKAISNLLERSWFKSLWVVQEVHLAPKCLFLCGEEELDWTTFRHAILTLWYNKAAIWRLPPEMRLIGNMVELLPEKHPVSDLFYQVYTRKCTVPRNRILGLLALFPQEFRNLIGLKFEEVYRVMTAKHIDYIQRLEMLRLCHGDRTQVADSPSWVPDLCSKLKISRRMDWQFAAGYSRCEVSFDKDLNKMKATGILCATIAHVHGPLPEGADTLESLELVRKWEPKDLETGTYPGGGSVRDAYARTLSGNALNDRFPERDYAGSFNEWIAQDSPTALFGEKAKTPLSADSNPTLMEKLALSLLPGRAFVRTKEGYFGLAPGVARKGKISWCSSVSQTQLIVIFLDDIIAVFLGCETPILLRPLPGNEFQVLGECLIPGLNDANALLELLPSSWKAQVFNDETCLFTNLRFLNSETGIMSDEDPRLGPLPEGWEVVERGERTNKDPRVFRRFRGMVKGKSRVVNWDPRMEPEALRVRGVELRSFVLV